MDPVERSTWRSAGVATAAAVAAAALVAGMPARALGQSGAGGAGEATPRSGFWLSGGLGGGLDGDGEAGGAAYLRLGGTPSRHLLLGFEGIGYARDAEGADATLSRGNATFVALWYPDVESGWFLKGGVGFAGTEVERDVAGGTLTVSDEGAGLTLGTGVDLQVGGNLFITPGFDLLLQSFDGLDTVDPLYLLTVGIGFH